MDIIKEMLKQMDEKGKNSIYLREIALLMEENELLKAKLRVNENLVKNHEEKIKELTHGTLKKQI